MKTLATLLLVLGMITPSLQSDVTPQEVMQWVIDQSIVDVSSIRVERLTHTEWEAFMLSMNRPSSEIAITNGDAITRGVLWVRLSSHPQAYTAHVWVHEALHYIHARLGTASNGEQLFHTEYIVMLNTDAIICNSRAFREAFPNVKLYTDDLTCRGGFVVPK